MPKTRSILFFVVAAVLLSAQLACDLGASVPQIELPSISTSVVEPTKIVVQQPPTPEIDVPDPQTGTGNVVGRIFWNDQPVIGTEVKLCEDFGMFSGCEGVNFSITTDNNGYYLFRNIPPGEYALAAHAIDHDTWEYVTEGLGFGANKYLVEADETLTIGTQSIYKFDLVQTSPGNDASIAEALPALTWDAYPGADYYEVYLTPERGQAIFVSDETNETQITPPQALLNCEYTWQIEAFNSSGVKIAENDGYYHFTVTGQEISCAVILISPQDSGNVSGENLELSWEEHPLASYYQVHIWDKDYKDILDGARSNETSYTVSQIIPPGTYTWYITAYNASDDDVARSDFYKFTIP